MTTVIVHNDQIDDALMVLRKKNQREGTLKLFRNRKHHEKKSRRLKMKAAESAKRKVRKKKMVEVDI